MNIRLVSFGQTVNVWAYEWNGWLYGLNAPTNHKFITPAGVPPPRVAREIFVWQTPRNGSTKKFQTKAWRRPSVKACPTSSWVSINSGRILELYCWYFWAEYYFQQGRRTPVAWVFAKLFTCYHFYRVAHVIIAWKPAGIRNRLEFDGQQGTTACKQNELQGVSRYFYLEWKLRYNEPINAINLRAFWAIWGIFGLSSLVLVS